MAVQQTSKNIVLFKYNGTPTVADVLTLDGNVFINPKVGSGEYKEVGNGFMGNTKSFVDEHHVTAAFDISVNIKKSTAGTPPSISSLLKASGLSETITAGASVSYMVGGTLSPSQAIVYIDGYKRAVTGVYTNFKITGKVGEIAKSTFSASGASDMVSVAESNPTVTLDTNVVVIVSKVSAVTVGGTSVNCTDFEFDLGNKINEIYAMGQSEYYLEDFSPTLTLTAIKVKGTDEQAWVDFGMGAIKEIIITLGAGAGGVVELKASNCVLNEVTESDDAGKVKIVRKFKAQANIGNDNFSLTWK